MLLMLLRDRSTFSRELSLDSPVRSEMPVPDKSSSVALLGTMCPSTSIL